MSTADILALGQDAVILAGIIAGYRLLKQGGGVQVKTPPAPKATTQPQQPAVKPVAVEDLAPRTERAA